MIPLSNDIEVPLLEALIEIGGEGKPRDVCPLVTKRFPQLTESELAETLKNGSTIWVGRIHGSRFTLTQKGEIDNSRYGIWAITDKGIKRVRESTNYEELGFIDRQILRGVYVDKIDTNLLTSIGNLELIRDGADTGLLDINGVINTLERTRIAVLKMGHHQSLCDVLREDKLMLIKNTLDDLVRS